MLNTIPLKNIELDKYAVIINARTLARLLVCLTLISILIPGIKLGGTVLHLDDFIALGTLILTLYIVRNIKNLGWAPQVLATTMLVLVAFDIGKSIAVSWDIFGRIITPTEMWQYVKRFLLFWLTVYAIGNIRHEETIKKIMYGVFFISLVIGILQFFGVSFLAEIYSRTDVQLYNLNKSMSSIRVVGVAGNSNAWGILCCFIFVLATCEARVSRGLTKLFFTSMCLLALFNIFFSGSRTVILMGLLLILWVAFSTLFSLLKKGNLIAVIFSISFVVGLVYILSNTSIVERVEFIIYRFSVLLDTGGGGRLDQIKFTLSLLSSPDLILGGLSNAGQRFMGIPWGIEVEPINVLVNYGAIGFFFRYIIVIYFFLLALITLNSKSYGKESKQVYLAILIYMFSSVSAFFWAEMTVGCIPWIFFAMWYTKVTNRKLTAPHSPTQ